MAEIVGLKRWLFLSAFLALILNELALPHLLPHMGAAVQSLGLPARDAPVVPLRLIALAASTIISILILNLVWRAFWRLPWLGAWLREQIFEDLNGEWEVEFRSNWPIIEKMVESSSDPKIKKFDPRTADASFPPFKLIPFKATIRQGWTYATAEIHSNGETPLLISRTISFDLIKKNSDFPHRVAWVFRQTNRDVEATDDSCFFGGAILEVNGPNELRGEYWNNRAWRKGLNAAGTITMRRVK